jgi:hypothetical protein
LRLAAVLIHATAAVIFLQLLAGGLLVFGSIPVQTHLITGFITFGFAMVTMGVTLVSKPAFRTVKILSIALVALIFLQGILGFIAIRGGTMVILIHFTNALVIYGVAVSSVFVARAWSKMPLTEKQGPVVVALVVSAAIWGALFAAEYLMH